LVRQNRPQPIPSTSLGNTGCAAALSCSQLLPINRSPLQSTILSVTPTIFSRAPLKHRDSAIARQPDHALTSIPLPKRILDPPRQRHYSRETFVAKRSLL